jgi:hypothetical protein
VQSRNIVDTGSRHFVDAESYDFVHTYGPALPPAAKLWT